MRPRVLVQDYVPENIQSPGDPGRDRVPDFIMRFPKARPHDPGDRVPDVDPCL